MNINQLKISRNFIPDTSVAGYINLKKEFSKKIAAQAGIRYEHTYTKGVSPDRTADDTETNYGKFFPSVYLAYKPNDINSININYSRRIRRPFFRALNPFKWYTNPNNVDEGNPLLRPSFADNIELGYVFRNNLSVMLYYQKENDVYGQVLRVADDNTTFSTYENIYNNKQLGANVSYSLNLFRWWNIYLAGNYVYNNSTIKNNEFEAQNGGAFDYRIDNNISLDKNKRFQLFLNYSQSLAYRKGTTYDKGYANCSAGFKCSFLENNLIVNLFANDIFKQDIIRREKIATTNRQTFNNYYDSQYFRISMVYKWGNKKNNHQKKNIPFNERNRI